MNLYNSYCYPDLTAVASSMKSDFFIGGGYVLTDAVVNLTDIDITAKSGINVFTYTVTPPICTKLGFDNSYTGITTADAVELGSQVSLVLIIAWGIKILRRSL